MNLEASEDDTFARMWRALKWDDAKEVDVREELLTPLLLHLGYKRGTVNEIKREEGFTLRQPFLMIGRTRIEIDYVAKVRLKRFLIVETKSPQDDIDHRVLLQAVYYANHPEIQARYVCLCNGKRLEVYRVGSDPYDQAVLEIDQTTVSEEQVRELRILLGARTIAASLRADTISTLRETLEVEVDEQEVDLLNQGLQSLIRDGRDAVKRNARAVTAAAWKRLNENSEKVRHEASLENLLIMLDIPTNAQFVYGHELGRRHH